MSKNTEFVQDLLLLSPVAFTSHITRSLEREWGLWVGRVLPVKVMVRSILRKPFLSGEGGGGHHTCSTYMQSNF